MNIFREQKKTDRLIRISFDLHKRGRKRRRRTLTQILEKKTFEQEVHILFVDLKKVYYNIPPVKLWKTVYKH